MKIDRLILGLYETNCYILRQSKKNTDCLIIDTGLEAGGLIDFLMKEKLNPTAVVLTHGHADHIAGLGILRKSFPEVKVYIHKLDAKMLTDEQSNLSELAGIRFSTEPADVLVEESSIIEEAGIRFGVIHTPGHTPGGICLHSTDEGIIFVGDTLFAGSVGRGDFPGGDMAQLLRSIKEKLFVLPDDTVCYPGHGPTTTIGQEKTYNPFLQ